MKRVFICSPYRADTQEGIEANVKVAQRICKAAIKNGAAPFAPHLIYPAILDDNDPEERSNGIQAGLEYLLTCREIWVWGTVLSHGMRLEIEFAQKHNIIVRFVNEYIVEAILDDRLK